MNFKHFFLGVFLITIFFLGCLPIPEEYPCVNSHGSIKQPISEDFATPLLEVYYLVNETIYDQDYRSGYVLDGSIINVTRRLDIPKEMQPKILAISKQYYPRDVFRTSKYYYDDYHYLDNSPPIFSTSRQPLIRISTYESIMLKVYYPERHAYLLDRSKEHGIVMYPELKQNETDVYFEFHASFQIKTVFDTHIVPLEVWSHAIVYVYDHIPPSPVTYTYTTWTHTDYNMAITPIIHQHWWTMFLWLASCIAGLRLTLGSLMENEK